MKKTLLVILLIVMISISPKATAESESLEERIESLERRISYLESLMNISNIEGELSGIEFTVDIQEKTDGSRLLTWTPCEGAIRYDIFSTIKGFSFKLIDTVNLDSPCTYTLPSHKVTFLYRVDAIMENGTAIESNICEILPDESDSKPSNTTKPTSTATKSITPSPTIQPTPTPKATATPSPTPKPTATPKPVTYTTLKKGSKGDDVKKLQEYLIKLGYLNDKADGSYGPKTECAVEVFQRINGIKVTGIADSNTQTKLYASDAKKAPVNREQYYEFSVTDTKGNTFDINIINSEIGKYYDLAQVRFTYEGKAVLAVIAGLKNRGDTITGLTQIFSSGAYIKCIYKDSDSIAPVIFPTSYSGYSPQLWELTGSINKYNRYAFMDNELYYYMFELPLEAIDGGAISLVFCDGSELRIR